MTSFERCFSLWGLCGDIIARQVPGDFVECGVWRGGSALIMGSVLKKLNQTRRLHLFDSFQGLPQPSAEDGERAADYSDGQRDGKMVPVAKCEATIDHVKSALFNDAKLDPSYVEFYEGWFQDTVPVSGNRLSKIAVLRLDGDWYASTQVCLEHLYPRLSSGGIIILDDYYCWDGCKKATDEYRAHHHINAPLIQVDNDCCYWIKP